MNVLLKAIVNNLPDINRQTALFIAVILICAAGVGVFLSIYFEAYQTPYMEKQIVDLSALWRYHTGDNHLKTLDNLKSGPKIKEGETLTLYRTLDVSLSEAALMIRVNHQYVAVYLDNERLFSNGEYVENENPGMSLHFILLPKDYAGKTLKLEITSPYNLYAGRTSPILMGTIPSLEAYALSSSMRSVIFMAMCLLLGLCTIALTLIQALNGSVRPQNLAVGVFAVVWAFYYVCTEYIVFQFFTPTQMSMFSLGFYFFMQVPLTMFFYFSFNHYQSRMLPAVILHSGFVAAAFILQFLDIVDLPRLININNIFLTGLLYTTVLSILEATKKNRLIMLAAPFLIIAYISMLYNFLVFYNRVGVVTYSYKDTYFLLILSILIYNVQQFFSQYYRQQRETDLLHLQNRLTKESYEQIKSHLQEVNSLKHEIKSHLAAMQTYLTGGRYEEAKNYLGKYAKQIQFVTEAAYHDNFLVNAVVGRLLQQAGELGVKVELNLKACRIGIADPDLYSLLNNILENALEACANLPENTRGLIRLIISRQEPYLHITCVNSKQGEIISSGEKIQTTKPDPASHGYGLGTVSRIVDAYDGIMDIDYDENTFTVTLALKDK